jgi:Annexin
VIETGLQRRGDQERAADPPGSPEASGPSEHEPVTPAVPNTLLGRAADEPPADDLLWEWSRWAPLAAPMSMLAEPLGAEDEGLWWGDVEPEPATVTVAPPLAGEESAQAAKREFEGATEPRPAAGPGRAPPKEAPAPAPAPGAQPGAAAGVPEAVAGEQPAVAEAPAEEGAEDASLEGPSGLQRWSAQVRTAVGRRIRAPSPADPEGIEIPMRDSVARVKQREAGRRAGATKAVKAAIPKAPDLPAELPPPPPIPVPEAEAAVAAAVGLQLEQQVLPKLLDYTHIPVVGPKAGKPQVVKPRIGLRLPPSAGAVLAPIPPPPKPGKQGRKKLAEVKAAGEQIKQGVVADGAFTLGTTPAPGKPGAPPTPPVSKADITGVLVRLRASIPDDAEAMLTNVRFGLYPKGSLQVEYKTLGADELLPELRTAITEAIDSIATQAGIDLATLHSATLGADGKVQLQKQQEHETVAKAGEKGRQEAEDEAKKSADSDAGARAAAEDAIFEKLRLAKGGASPEQIRDHRDKLVQRVNRRLAPEDLRYEREGEDRIRALRTMEVAYEAAYADVARQVAERIKKDAEPPRTTTIRPAAKAAVKPAAATASAVTPAPTSAEIAPPPPSTAPATPAETWSIERVREVRARFAELIGEVQRVTKAHRDAIVRARVSATEALHQWADREIGDRTSGWERLWDRIRSWGEEARDVAKAWEEARTAALHADLQGDLAFINEIESGARSEAEMRALAGIGSLSEAQKAIVTAYFTEPRDKLSAVAAGMRVRIAAIRTPRLKEQLDEMLYKQPPSEWPRVAAVAESEGGGISIVKRGEEFHASVDQWGTDESKLYASLTGLTKLQRHALDLWYREEHDSTIAAELKDELEDAELDRAEALMRGDELAADAAAIRDEIESVGTDEQEIYRALRKRNSEDRARLEAIYLDRYKVTLAEDLEKDLSGEELKRAEALRQGDIERADAIGLQYAQTGKWHGGPDSDEIQAIYAQNRAELEQQAAREGWTSDELKAKVLARNKAIDEAHKAEYRSVTGGPGEGLRASFEKNLRGPARDLALGLHDQDWARADAARLEIERRSFITDDKVVNQILESQYTRARKEATLDAEHDLAFRRDLAMVRGEMAGWDEKKQRDAMQTAIHGDALKRSEGYMNDLKATYDTSYKYDPLYEVSGRGGFDNLIADHLMGSDKDRALALVKGHGYLTPAQEIKYAVQGAGTDLDVIKRMLEGKTPAEIEQMEKDWQELHKDDPQPVPSLKDRVMEEVSGRDAFDVRELLKGEPQTPKDKLEAAKRKRDYEKSAYALGNTFGSKGEAGRLDAEVARLEETVARLNAAPEGSREADYLRWKVDQGVMAVDARVEAHRRSVDWLADTMAMAAAITAGLLITALTWGAAGPVIAGALGALAAAEATIITKLAVKGGAMSDEELLVDVVSGAVDVVFAVATAGVGNALLRVAKGVPIGPLAKMATSASRTKRMVAHGLANSVEGFLGGIPSAAAGALVDEKTWSNGNVLGTVAGAAWQGGITGAGMGGVMGSGGGIRKPGAPPGPRLDPGRPPDLDAAAKAFDQATARGPDTDPATLAARAGEWHAHQARHPSASYADFLADIEAGRITPDPAAAATFTKAAREAMAAGLPASERALVADVAVHVLSDAEFGRLTRSGSGLAVTVIKDGQPVILMREGSPLAALREEGIHAAQALDPRLAADARLLDEARMARWSSLDLGTKLEMYRAKLDLELDAHRRLLAGLVDQIDELPPGAARDALVDQADAARRNMANLADRRVELDSFGPLDRLAARFGRGRLAARLDQPPRLFSKPPKATVKKGTAKTKAVPQGPATKAATKAKAKAKSRAKPKAKAAAAAAALDPNAPYPGARPELIDRPTAAPRKDSLHPEGGVWKEKVVGLDSLVRAVDADGAYWTFPELVDGEVLILPSGTRVWRDPGTKMIIEEHPVGMSVSSQRSRTRGEDVLFLPEDVGPEAAGMQRLHGAASPGLGFDSPYSIARGTPEVNLAIENSGIELWVRRLRTNAPEGVQYVFTTGTSRTARGDLTGRTYKVSAIVDGNLVDMVSFRLDVGPPPVVKLDSRPSLALVEFGFPPLKPKSPDPSGATPRPVDMPEGIRRRLGFDDRPGPKRTVPPEKARPLDLNKQVLESVDRISDYRVLRQQPTQALDDLRALLEHLRDWVGNAAPSDPRLPTVTRALENLHRALRRRRFKVPDERRVFQEFREAVEEVITDE